VRLCRGSQFCVRVCSCTLCGGGRRKPSYAGRSRLVPAGTVGLCHSTCTPAQALQYSKTHSTDTAERRFCRCGPLSWFRLCLQHCLRRCVTIDSYAVSQSLRDVCRICGIIVSDSSGAGLHASFVCGTGVCITPCSATSCAEKTSIISAPLIQSLGHPSGARSLLAMLSHGTDCPCPRLLQAHDSKA